MTAEFEYLPDLVAKVLAAEPHATHFGIGLPTGLRAVFGQFADDDSAIKALHDTPTPCDYIWRLVNGKDPVRIWTPHMAADRARVAAQARHDRRQSS
jgi:hypothetical protein